MTDPRGRACRLILAEKFSLLCQAPTALLLIGCSVRTRIMQIHRSDSVSGCSRYHYRSAGVNAQNATSLSCHRALHPRNSGDGGCEGTLKDGANPNHAGPHSDGAAELPQTASSYRCSAVTVRTCGRAAVPKNCGP